MAVKSYKIMEPEGVSVARSLLGDPAFPEDASDVDLEFENEGQERAVLAAGWLEEADEPKPKGKK